MKSMPIFTGLTQLLNDHKPRVLPSLPYPNPNLHPLTPPSPSPCPLNLLISYPHPRVTLILPSVSPPFRHPPSYTPLWSNSGFFTLLWVTDEVDWKQAGGGARRGGCWFRLWSPFIKNTMFLFGIQSEDWGVEESCCVLRLKVVNLFASRFLQWHWSCVLV